MKLDRDGDFCQHFTKVVEASYEISLLIVRTKKPHNIGETLVKPCIFSSAKLVLGEDSYQRLSEVSLFDSTVSFELMKWQIILKPRCWRTSDPRNSSSFSVTRLQMCLSALIYLYMHGSLEIEPWRRR